MNCVTEDTMPRKPKAGVAAEATLTLRMTDADRALLDRLVALRAEELAALGADEIDVTAASYVRSLIRREAKAKGLTAPAAGDAPATPPKRTSTPADEPDAKAVHAALLRAIERGAVANQIAAKAGVDRSALSKFKSKGTGLSTAKLRALAAVL